MGTCAIAAIRTAPLLNEINSKLDQIDDEINKIESLIIFERLTKFDGNGITPVPAQQIRQIAGRAGRFATKHEFGLVTCLKMEDFAILEAALGDLHPKPYTKAGIKPVFDQIEAIRKEFPRFDLADILDSFAAFARIPDHYFLSEMRTVRKLLEILRGMELDDVMLEELFLFLSAPVKVENEEVAATFLYVLFDNYNFII